MSDDGVASVSRVRPSLTVIAFLINVLFSFGIGTLGWFGAPTNAELSAKYQTLVTPAGTAFSIWGLIFTWEAVFVIAVVYQACRSSLRALEARVCFWYIVSCLFQSAWAVAFSLESLMLSLAFMLGIWTSLLFLLMLQIMAEDNEEKANPWLYRVPFAIHFGWITAASLVNLNVVVVGKNASAPLELAFAILSLVVLFAASMVLTYFKAYFVVGVLSWATFWIYVELLSPAESIQERFGQDVTGGLSYAALTTSFVIALEVLVSLAGNFIFSRICKSRNPNGDTSALSESFVRIEDGR